nr:hypothetical protein [Halomonas sp. KRD171]
MNAAWLPLTALATSLLVVVIIFALPEDARRLRTTINLMAAVVKIILVILMVRRVAAGHEDIFSFQVIGGVDFVLRSDAQRCAGGDVRRTIVTTVVMHHHLRHWLLGRFS